MEEGPTSHLDLIELKGFDDDPHTDKSLHIPKITKN
jgi:hypothetical protein